MSVCLTHYTSRSLCAPKGCVLSNTTVKAVDFDHIVCISGTKHLIFAYLQAGGKIALSFGVGPRRTCRCHFAISSRTCFAPSGPIESALCSPCLASPGEWFRLS